MTKPNYIASMESGGGAESYENKMVILLKFHIQK